MVKKALTAVGIDRLRPPAVGQVEYVDAGFPDLALRVSHGGTKTFVFYYRRAGRRRRMTLGRWPVTTLGEAREAWRELRKAIERGEDPGEEKRSNEFGQIADEWLKRDQAGNKSIYEVTRILNREIRPAFEGRDIGDITRRDCLGVINKVVDRGKTTQARRVHSYMSRLFKWAVSAGIVDASPMMGVLKPGNEVSRDRIFEDSELATVWSAATSIGWPFGDAVKLLILTAARRDEISALRWSEVQGDKIVLGSEKMKNKKQHIIPLSDSARALLDSVPRLASSDLVFTTTGKTPISGWSRAKVHLDALCGDLEPWRLHDIRRTAATGLQRLGEPLQVVEAVLGHISGSRAGVVGVYQRHEYTDEKRRALARWAAHVAGVVDGHQANVVPLYA